MRSGRQRVCILTPGALGSNPRVVKEAEALHDAGSAVTVISTRTLAQVDCRDEVLLARASWRSLRLDFRDRRNRWRLRRLTQIAWRRAFELTAYPGFADRAFSPFTAPLAAVAQRLPADLYIAHYPAALPAAAIAARRHHTSYAFDAEDFHAGDWPDEVTYEKMRQLLRAVEARHLPGCTYVTAASPGIADAYVAAYKIPRPSVLLNVFPRIEAPLHPTSRGVAQPRPTVYWFSQTLGPDRGLECAVKAIARARTQPHLHLRGSPALGFRQHLVAIAEAAGVSERLHLLPPAAPGDMVRLAASFDLGFSGEPGHTDNNRIALGNKLFTYLLAGLPSVMSDIEAHRSFAPSLGNAVRLYSAGNPHSLAAVLDELLGNPAALAAARMAAFHLGQTRFNWDIEKAVLLERAAARAP